MSGKRKDARATLTHGQALKYIKRLAREMDQLAAEDVVDLNTYYALTAAQYALRVAAHTLALSPSSDAPGAQPESEGT